MTYATIALERSEPAPCAEYRALPLPHVSILIFLARNAKRNGRQEAGAASVKSQFLSPQMSLRITAVSGTIEGMRKYLLGYIVISAMLVPVLANAATADEIRAQIQSLLSQLTALQSQLSNLTTDTTIATSTNTACPNLYRTLSRGSRGSDVISLQQFLIAQGLLSNDSATGFFGRMTESAVQRWQAQNSLVSYGDAVTPGYGVIDVRTRAALAARCVTKPPVVQSCPQYQIPICNAGQRVENGAINSNGCVGAPRCVNNPVSCPIYNACPSGYTTNTSTDTDGCTVRQCVPPATSSSWSIVDVNKFTISLPSDWIYNSKQGIDSIVGEFAGDNIRLAFDYRWYSGNPSLQPNPEYTLTTETIGGRSVQVITPKVSGQGGIGIYFGDADGNGGMNALTVSGYNIPATLQEKVLQILRSARLKSVVHTASPSISITIPQIIDYINRGFDFPIKWVGKNAPTGSQVYLTLIRADGATGGGVITDHQLIGDTYTWRIPAASDRAMLGGDYYLHGVDITNGVSYKVRATIYMASTAQCFEGCPPSMGTDIAFADSGTFVIQ